MPTIDPRLVDLSASALTCRTYNHKWTPTRTDGGMVATAFKGKKPVQVEERLVCPDCTTVRQDIYSYPDFETVVRKYTYPDGYRLRSVDGAPRMLRVDYRLALFDRRKPVIVTADE